MLLSPQFRQLICIQCNLIFVCWTKLLAIKMDVQPNCRGAQPSCFGNFTNTSLYEEFSEEFRPSGSSSIKTSFLKLNCMQDCNAEEEEQLRWPIKQKPARTIPRKFSRAKPLTDEELDHKRVTANVQERRRMQRLNTALEKLKRAIPQHLHMQYRRLSKIKTLKLAIDYIGFLEEILKPNFERQLCANASQVQMYETKNVNTFNSEVCTPINAVLEDEEFQEKEEPNPRPVISAFPTSVTCADVLQHNQFNSYFVDIALPQENEGFRYLEQF